MLFLIFHLGCQVCSEEYPEKCPNCGPMRPIENTAVEEGDPLRARKTLSKCLYIDQSSKHGLGVFVKERLELGVYFGPYEGIRREVKDPDLDPRYAFKVSFRGKQLLILSPKTFTEQSC